MIMGFITSTLLFLLLLLLWSGSSSGLNSDGTLLLSFRYSVLSDPLSVLDNWVYTDETPCSWTGITCAQIGDSPGSPEMFRVTGLLLPNSQLLGSIPDALGFLQHLRQLDLSSNFLNGTLPASLFNASELQVLSLSNNLISGEIPDLSAGPTHLQVLNLSENALAGKVPENLTAVRNLTVVSLRSNYFSGRIPSGFDSVEVLDLSSNLFNGTLPDDFGGENLRNLNLSNNKLSGSINSEFAKKIPANASIDLSFNNLTGEIPQLMALLNQKTDSFAGNVDLCGKPLKKLCTIPSTLSIPPNNGSSASSSPAIAAIPKTIYSNAGKNLTQPNGTSNQPQRRLKPGTIAGITVGDLAGIGVLAMIFLYVYKSKKKNKMNADNSKAYITNKDQANAAIVDELSLSKDHPKTQGGWSCLSIGNGEETSEATGSDSDGSNGNGDGVVEAEEVGKERSVLVMVDGETKLEVETLLKASAYVLGSSGRSIVYKAVVEGGVAFAVRRIGDGCVRRLRDFESHVRAVAKLRHPNLVRVRGFYWGSDEKLVIYDYISNGSLASVSGAGGYKKMGSSPSHLSFDVRLKIARGVARGLAFIHEKKSVHGNIKPANILLTRDMEPVISDLGLDRLLPADTHRRSSASASATRHFGSKRSAPSRDDFPAASPYSTPPDFVGCTSPYHAPESLENLKPSPKWDVYSFGILLLELLTGRVFSEQELGAGSASEDRTRLARMAGAEDKEDAAMACLKLGFSCAALAPQRRPSMKEALQVLDKMPSSSCPY
ncbi:probable LRR receptor-like serine/threonine-protein kinase At4g37250 [Diospyros lotus]|uniref:probable LRR receptor-like serine/threonine-protein kinase At4g37250 n=1 Tax=Diospyros lotus TaxID=55363 RepID=UPI002257966E|nr:probable LRR receptor-like serine/threonine-protein kinase At4g37250 [Diospyros lotus]